METLNMTYLVIDLYGTSICCVSRLTENLIVTIPKVFFPPLVQALCRNLVQVLFPFFVYENTV